MNSYCFGAAQPQIPGGLLHDMYEIRSGAVFSQEQGGQWIPGENEKIRFKGVMLPVTDKDLIRDAGGTITKNTVKIYTNGHALTVGGCVEDGDGAVYTIIQELDHNSLHPLKRYLVERKGRTAAR